MYVYVAGVIALALARTTGRTHAVAALCNKEIDVIRKSRRLASNVECTQQRLSSEISR